MTLYFQAYFGYMESSEFMAAIFAGWNLKVSSLQWTIHFLSTTVTKHLRGSLQIWIWIFLLQEGESCAEPHKGSHIALYFDISPGASFSHLGNDGFEKNVGKNWTAVSASLLHVRACDLVLNETHLSIVLAVLKADYTGLVAFLIVASFLAEKWS